MIKIKPSTTADSRTCDYTKVTKEQLLESSEQHRDDVAKGFDFFIDLMKEQSWQHDWDKLADIDGFHRDFKNGFETRTWYKNHLKVNRHHLNEPTGVPEDVNLIDVLDMIADCVMAGMGRSGEVRPINIDPDILSKAVHNTTELLKSQIIVEKD